jgi:hypothetical protein
MLSDVRCRRVPLLLLITLAASTAFVRPAVAASPPPFHATVSRIDADTRELMVGRSWHKGCPVSLGKLRLIVLRFWGFDAAAHWGHLVVHRSYARRIVSVFKALYRNRFPIRRMLLVDRYGADDLKSMEHDNTSGFNCRWRAGQPGVWSMHAYGKAIDVDPLENPYVRGDHVSPPGGRRYLDRSKHLKGMIHDGDATVDAFAAIGWEWGGAWTGTVKDYQHFSANNH